MRVSGSDSVLKWSATATLIIGSFVNSLGFYPAGPILLLLGGVLWLMVAVRWREPSMIVTNAFMVLAGGLPLVYRFWN
jgi:hypothetical protein